MKTKPDELSPKMQAGGIMMKSKIIDVSITQASPVKCPACGEPVWFEGVENHFIADDGAPTVDQIQYEMGCDCNLEYGTMIYVGNMLCDWLNNTGWIDGNEERIKLEKWRANVL